MMTDDLLKQGVAALKEGRKAEARRLLSQLLEQDERSEMGWLWMSGVVDTDTERRICLENVLAINPNNGIAKRGLEGLGASQITSPFTTVQPLSPSAREVTTPEKQSIQPLVGTDEPETPDQVEDKEGEAKEEPDQAPPPQRSTKRWSGLNIALLAGLLGIACVATVGIWWAINNGLLSFGSVPTLVPTVNAVQTSTPTDIALSLTSDSPPPSTQTPRPTEAPHTLVPTRTPRPTNTPLLTWTPSLTPTATMTTTPTSTPTPAMTLPPTWTPAPGMTRPPTWTPLPTNTPALTVTLRPTWTPASIITQPPTWTPAPIMTLPPTWTPAYNTSTPTVTPTLTLTSTVVITATPGE